MAYESAYKGEQIDVAVRRVLTGEAVGPQGSAGPPGADGADGKNGKDGVDGLLGAPVQTGKMEQTVHLVREYLLAAQQDKSWQSGPMGIRHSMD